MNYTPHLDLDQEYYPIHGLDPTWHPYFEEKIKWLKEYEGKGSFSLGGSSVYFTNKEDAAMFALRWK